MAFHWKRLLLGLTVAFEVCEVWLERGFNERGSSGLTGFKGLTEALYGFNPREISEDHLAERLHTCRNQGHCTNQSSAAVGGGGVYSPRSALCFGCSPEEDKVWGGGAIMVLCPWCSSLSSLRKYSILLQQERHGVRVANSHALSERHTPVMPYRWKSILSAKLVSSWRTTSTPTHPLNIGHTPQNLTVGFLEYLATLWHLCASSCRTRDWLIQSNSPWSC